MMFSVLLSQLGMLITSVPNIQAADLGSTTTDGVTTTVSQKGCAIKIETKQEVNWGLPRQPIDLVILQDASGSFTNTIRNVKDALIDLTTPVAADQYDEKNPRLVFTDDPKTTDRVMVASYGGADGYRVFDSADGNNIATSDSNFTVLGGTAAQNGYRFTSTGASLLSSKQQIDDYINGFTVGGLTPTVPAIDQILDQYNTAKLQGGGMANNRKTVFLLITDGVANVHDVNGTKYLDLSAYRMQHLAALIRSGRSDYNAIYNYARTYGYLGEFGQNYIARANELKDAGNRIKQAVGDDGTVVVGFWEDQSQFIGTSAYWNAYLDGSVFARAGINTGDDRSVREVFEEALKSVSSPDKEINGENVSFYVNEQNDINAFSTKILKAVTSALTKENIVGDFTVTDGYKVNSVTINGKKVVETVTNENTEIKGTVTQEGTKVTISVPDSIFNPGKNSFEYDLTKTAAEDAALSEDEETDPADGYQPETKTETVGQLTGRFKVGDYVSDEIGSKDPTTVQVTDLKYCYPSATKSITDKDQSNDTGQLDDPVVKGKKSYAANLSTFSEGFTYQVLYRMNNAPLNFEANPMLIDKLDYRLEYVDAYVTGQDGQRLNNFNIRTTTGNDALGNQRTIVVADIPEAPGTQTQYVDEGKYGAHKFKQYTLHVKVRIKDQYSNANNPVVYRQILQENDGLGILNQANIVWNGKTNNPEDEEAKTRRSNTVYVKPPVETDIKKDVQSVPNKEAGYKPGNSQEYLENRTQEFYYNVESSWPGLFDTYSISDTLVPELEVISAEVFINDTPSPTLSGKLAIDANKQSVALNLVKADVNARLNLEIRRATANYTQPAVVRIGIKAKIRDNANLAKYVVNGEIKVPNEAQVVLNGKPQKSNIVYVTPKEPGISKKINDSKDEHNVLQESEDFTFDIKTKLPDNISAYKSYKIVDVLDERLELKDGAQPFVNAELSQHFDVSYDAASRTVTAAIKPGSFALLSGGETVHLTIPAKVKSGTAFAQIPNEAKVYYRDPSSTGEKETPPTPPVIVTPPPVIEKQVNGKQHADLTKRDEVFEYTIKSTVPKGADTFEITDELDEALEFAGNQGDVVVKIADTVVTDAVEVSAVGRNLGIKFTKEQLTNDAGKPIVVTFKAKIRGDANLSADKYVQTGTTLIPNTAKYILNNNPKESNKVTVTPPTPPTPTVDKKVNGKAHENLTNRDQTFEYSISTQVPTDAKKFEITDELKDVLEFAGADGKGEVVVKIGDKDVTQETTVKTENQNLTINLTSDQLSKLQGQAVVVTFKAKIRANVNLSDYITDGAVKVPNVANITVDNKPKVTSEPVTVTPPSPENPPIVKDVNGADRADLATREESFTYHITSAVPTDATAFEISDTLVDVLEFDGEKGGATVTIDGKDASADATIAVQDQRLTVTLSEAQVKANGGKEVVVSFTAKIRPGANLSAYKVDGKTEIPNTAEYVINNNPETKKKSNEVPVTPPSPENPPIVKDVNGADRADLATREESFTYHITSAVPTDATAFEISDTLVDVLEFDGEKGGATVTIDGKDASADATIAVQDQRLTVTLSEAQVKANGGKEVVVSFTAKIRPGANLSAYKVDGKTEIPNTAEYVINNNPETKKKSNEVPVTPPSPENPPIVKDVNGKESDTLANRYDIFTYHISTSVPNDATAFTITDTLVPVLEFSGDIAVEIDGKLISANTTIDNQTLTVDLTEEQVRNNGGKPVVVTFNAKIRSGANLSAYIVDGKTAVPNTAEYVINNNPETKKKSNEVPVYPPTPEGGEPEIDKKINKTLDYLEIARGKSYNYDITTTIPEDIVDYKEFVITDQVDSALQINGDVVVDIDGYSAEGIVDVVVDGQAVTVAVKDFSKLEGRSAIHIFIPATIRPEADLSTYVDNSVPNTANLHFTNGPGVTKDKSTVPVIVTPPTPPTPVPPTPGDPTKTVNTADGNEQAFHLDLLQRTSDFRYDIAYTIEADSQYTAFTMEDTLESVLNIQRVAIKVGSGENLVLKEFAELEAKLAEAKGTLETLEAKKTEITNTVSSVATMATELEAQKVRIAEIEQELAIKEAELATASAASTESTVAPSTTEETDGTSVVDESTDNSQPVVDKQAEIQALTVAIEQLKASKDQVQQTVVELEQQIEVANTSEASLAALEVEIRNATASIEELEKQLAEKTPKATIAREVEAALLAVNEKGELTDASAAILGQVSIDKATNHVVFDITNPDVLASLRGRQVTMSIYATINPEADLSNYVTDKGIELVPNTASVTFDRNPQTKKKTNTVTVTPPPLPEPPGPPTPLPPLPPVEPPVPSDPPTQPTPPTPPTTPPAESTPPTPGKTLPKTGVAENGMYALVGMILGTLTLVFRRRKQ
ncbi:isopeptide-forming domain-containing fimbrial protein [Streptococcus suis]|uniref:isopeptide-forming domain-containing fimbrial protein n=1 Tax=Streptococcus suis TaxID=1307 RepID=UPI000A5837B7|nr:isopeptide-forming domain-containing fimbrial protein [Streptococcus suis]